MSSVIALDIETTGLDPQVDAIIEIGACRFNGYRIEEEWSTLVNPGRHIPEFITNLTGISNEMVRQAPRLREVLGDLTDFVGNLPILGHNIPFDLSFFKKYGLFELNERIDTYEMAAVLLPTAGRYNLGALGATLGIPLPATHRALDDVRLTQVIFLRLYEEAMDLPLDLIAEIVRHNEPIEWDGSWPFRQILQARRAERAVKGGRERQPNFAAHFEKFQGPPPKIPEQPIPIDPEEIASLLAPRGPFSTYFEHYEHRPEQIAMLQAVAEVLSQGKHLLVEAGTGVGKSFAYLVPAALFALQNHTRVVVSTNTINLQDQLIKKDIPDLRAALGLDRLYATVLKGRSNYLCPRRLEAMRKHGPRNAHELRVLAKVLVWLHRGGSGDRTELNLHGPSDRQVWSHLSAEDEGCTPEVCLERQGGNCPFFLARQAAQHAHILVVNHALLLTDAASGNRVLPEYDYLIVDEAHHLDSATTEALSWRLDQTEVERLLREIGSPAEGALGDLLGCVRNQIRPSDYAILQQKADRATNLAWRLQEQSRAYFQSLTEFIAMQREEQVNNSYAHQERILPSTRTLPGWDDIEIVWDAMEETMRLLASLLGEIQKDAADLYSGGLEALEDLVSYLGNLYRRLSESTEMIHALMNAPSKDYVYWVEIGANHGRLSLHAAPIQVGPLVEKYLWHEKSSIILTSATLTAHGEFDYLRNNLYADEAEELALGSPFDYESSALLYLVNDIAEPHTSEYQTQVERALIQLCRASGGRTLALFTSYAQLKRTSRAITAPLGQSEIIVYEQGEGASPNALLETFKTSERAVLLGTRSFWEGIDVPGEALSVLVIVKLPFAVPTDPLVAARSETFEDPFHEYHLPEAILRFRQGFGRLIRTQSDRGVVAILDRRVLTKNYGRMFLESLPPCTVRVGPLAALPRIASQWLGQK